MTVVEPPVENRVRPCDNQGMTKAELHELVDRLPDGAVDGAAVLLGEISAGRIDPEQAWFWTRQWQEKEHEADDDLAAGRVTPYETDAEFLAALDERTKPLDADAWSPRVVLARLGPTHPATASSFREAVAQFIADIADGGQSFHPRLRVKRVQGHRGVREMTWAPDGRATFEYGAEVRPGEPHVIWRRIGTHSVFRRQWGPR